METVNSFDNVKAASAPIDRNNDSALMMIVISVLVLGLFCSHAFPCTITPPPEFFDTCMAHSTGVTGEMGILSNNQNDLLDNNLGAVNDIGNVQLPMNDPFVGIYCNLNNRFTNLGGSVIPDDPTTMQAFGGIENMTPIAGGSYSSGLGGRCMVVRPPVPEPSTILLILLSSGSFFLARKTTPLSAD